MLGYDIVNKGGKQGRITIEGEISWWRNTSSAFTRQVDQLLADGVIDLEVYINTPGGQMFDAYEIGNQIARFSGTKKAKLGALCASAGTLISCYCDEVEASKNTQFMIHDPIRVSIIEHVDQWETEKQAYVNLRDTALELYSQKTGLDIKTLDEMMKKTTWLTAKQAKEKGFVDSIADNKSPMPEDAKNVLEPFKNAAKLPVYLNYLFEETPKDVQEAETITNITKTNTMEGNDTPNKSGIRAVVALAKSKGLNEKTIQKMAEADLDAALEFVEDYTAPQVSNTTKPETPAADTTNIANTTTPPATPPQNQERLTDVFKQALAENGGSQAKTQPKMSYTEMSQKDPVGLKKLLQTNPKEFANMFEEEFGYRPTELELSAFK